MMLQAQTTQEESQRMTAVRKAYQKAIVTPTHHVEQLWKDYENFENSVSRALVFFGFDFLVFTLTLEIFQFLFLNYLLRIVISKYLVYFLFFFTLINFAAHTASLYGVSHHVSNHLLLL